MNMIKIHCMAGQWCHTPLIQTLGRQRQEDLRVSGQPGLQSLKTKSHNETITLCNLHMLRRVDMYMFYFKVLTLEQETYIISSPKP